MIGALSRRPCLLCRANNTRAEEELDRLFAKEAKLLKRDVIIAVTLVILWKLCEWGVIQISLPE